MRLTLGIGNLISFHSLSAGHVALGWVMTKLVLEHWLNSCIFGCNGLFSVTAAVIRFHHVFDESSLL